MALAHGAVQKGVTRRVGDGYIESAGYDDAVGIIIGNKPITDKISEDILFGSLGYGTVC